ncbi:MAG: hypothetical protein Q4C50_04085 [Eubacteriales bacterium]|nr:hypothetical protein [Eubacteriales bacterium]
MDNHKSCNCIRECPCYPECDRMMEEGRLPGKRNQNRQMQVTPATSQTPESAPAGSQTPGYSASAMPQAPESAPVMPRSPGYSAPATPQVPGYAASPAPEREASPWFLPNMETRQASEEENERDWEKLKEMYPEMAKIVLAEVENVCDSMEYEGSMMFDDTPDKVRVQKMAEDIYERVKERYPKQETEEQDDMYVMNREPGRRPPRQDWLGDFIQVMIYQEMFHRRCRRRNCRRW